MTQNNQALKTELAETESRSQEIAANAGVHSLELAIQELRSKNEDLQSLLSDTSGENKELRTKLESQDLQQQQACVETAIREEQVQIARERAEFSRQRSDLIRQVSDLEQLLSKRKPVNEAEQRFQAFREHLKEIHEKQKQEKPKVKPISKRLKELWQRLDGPTDTD